MSPKRPNWSNAEDACCRCGKRAPCPKDHEKPGAGDHEVWQPNSHDPPQWICKPCRQQLEADERRAG